MRGILDGHIVLSRELANRNHYPAIDVLTSISRLMNDIVTADHQKLAGQVKNILSTYKDAEDLINIGAYEKGNNPRIDESIKYIDSIKNFLRQGIDEKIEYEQTIDTLKKVLKNEIS